MRYFPEIVTEFIFTSRHLSQPVNPKSTEDTVVLLSSQMAVTIQILYLKRKI